MVHFTSVHEVLGSISSTTKERKKEREKMKTDVGLTKAD